MVQKQNFLLVDFLEIEYPLEVSEWKLNLCLNNLIPATLSVHDVTQKKFLKKFLYSSVSFS